MRNRITNYRKTLHHLTLLFGFGFICFIANSAAAKSVSINVYLKLKPENRIQILVKEFNQYLAQQGLLTRYQIIPYLNHHPLHITLYLTNYDSQQIPHIIQEIKQLAQQEKPILFSTEEFIPNRMGYVMLRIAANQRILELSAKTLNALVHLRDTKATVPTWAAQDPKQRALFDQYGSPSVFQYFNPHFSIFSAPHLNPNQSKNPKKQQSNTFLYQQLQHFIHQFTQAHPTKIQENAPEIAVGLADAQGQIIKELAVFAIK